jgi:hypothetical protein
MNNASSDEQLGEAYDLVEEIWNDGQPPNIDWKELGDAASRLAALCRTLDLRYGGDSS